MSSWAFTRRDDPLVVARVRMGNHPHHGVKVYAFDAPGERTAFGMPTVGVSDLTLMGGEGSLLLPDHAEALGNALIRAAKVARGQEPRPSPLELVKPAGAA
jgi:hypothetical protein